MLSGVKTLIFVTIQAQIISVLKNMKEKYNLTIVFITHDLGVVANVADCIAVWENQAKLCLYKEEYERNSQ